MFKKLGATNRTDAVVKAASLTAAPDVDFSQLSTAEEPIPALVAEGLTNQLIAGRLGLSPNTVKTHLNRIYRKLGINSLPQTESIKGGPRHLSLSHLAFFISLDK